MAKSNATRQKEFRQRRRQRGGHRVTLWLSAENVNRLRALAPGYLTADGSPPRPTVCVRWALHRGQEAMRLERELAAARARVAQLEHEVVAWQRHAQTRRTF